MNDLNIMVTTRRVLSKTPLLLLTKQKPIGLTLNDSKTKVMELYQASNNQDGTTEIQGHTYFIHTSTGVFFFFGFPNYSRILLTTMLSEI